METNYCDYGHQTKDEIRRFPYGSSGAASLICEKCFIKFEGDDFYNPKKYFWNSLKIVNPRIQDKIVINKVVENYTLMLKQYIKQHKSKNLRLICEFSRKNIIKQITISQTTEGVGVLDIIWHSGGYIYNCNTSFKDYNVLIKWLKSRRTWRGLTVLCKYIGNELDYSYSSFVI